MATAAFDSSLEKMTKNIGLALEGTGAQKDALDALGLSANDLATMLPEEALGLIADRMQRVATQAEKAALANDIFGRSGIGMLNMLRDGSSGLRDLRDAARRTGYVLSEQTARDAEVFQDTLLDTQLIMKGLKNTVGAELMPVVTQSMRRIGDALVGNREEVKVWAASFADGVERALPVIGELGYKGNMERAVGGIGSVFEATWTNVIKPVTDALGITEPIEAAWRGVSSFFGGLFGDVGSYFTGLSDMVGGVFTGDMTRAGNGIKTMWSATSSALGRTLDGIGAIYRGTWNNVIKPVTDALGITEPIEAAWTWVSARIDAIVSNIGSAFDLAWTTFIKPVVDGLSNTGGIGAAWESVKAGLDPILTWIGEKFSAVLGFIQPVLDALKWVVDKGVGAATSIGNAVGLGSSGSVMDGADGQTAEPNAGLARLRNGIPADIRGPSVIDRFQTNALGGPFRPGWHLTGEMAPELKFENRSGYVANNRAMRQLASYADRVGSAMPQARTAGQTAGTNMSRAQRSLRSHRTGPQGATQALSAMSARIEAALGGTPFLLSGFAHFLDNTPMIQGYLGQIRVSGP